MPNTNQIPIKPYVMATMQGDKIRGTIGEWVYAIDPVTKKQLMRRKPKKVRNPKTESQQAHRNSFVDIVRLSSRMTEAHLLGLHRHAQRVKLRTYADFRRLNKDCFTPDGLIDYPRIVLSRGPVAKVLVNNVQLNDDGLLRVDFDPCMGQENAASDDTLHLYVYNADLEEGCLFLPVLRRDGTLSVQLPAEWLLQDNPASKTNALTHSNTHTFNLHLYAFLRNRKGHTSDTLYIPLL